MSSHRGAVYPGHRSGKTSRGRSLPLKTATGSEAAAALFQVLPEHNPRDGVLTSLRCGFHRLMTTAGSLCPACQLLPFVTVSLPRGTAFPSQVPSSPSLEHTRQLARALCHPCVRLNVPGTVLAPRGPRFTSNQHADRLNPKSDFRLHALDHPSSLLN